MMLARSFILHFKKAALFTAAAIAVTGIMNYLYVDNTNEFSRYALHEFYQEKQNIDRLYLGSSHVYCDINPVILDDINGDNNFNLATSLQQLNTSYYLLREAGKKHHIEKVYLDFYYTCMVGEAGHVHDYRAFPNSWRVMDEMKPSLNKLSYMLDLSSPEYYYMTFLPFTRYKEELFNLDYVAKIVNEKQSDAWKNHEYRHIFSDGTVMSNGKKGFRISYETPDPGGFHIKNDDMSDKKNPMIPEPESLEYLLKIIEYCKEHNIELTWIGCPISDFQLVSNGNYDNYIHQIAKLAEQYGIPYYDFNLCKREYLDVSHRNYWSDMGHLNTDGSEIFTRFLGEFFMAQEAGDDTFQDCFYNSYEEKIQTMPEEIYGLETALSKEYERYMPDTPQEQWEDYVIYIVHPVTNASEENIDVNIRVVNDRLTEESEEPTIIRDGKDACVILRSDDHGVLYAEVKLKDSAKEANWVEIDY